MAIYELNTDYVTYCKMLGMGDMVIQSYVFRNAMLPQINRSCYQFRNHGGRVVDNRDCVWISRNRINAYPME